MADTMMKAYEVREDEDREPRDGDQWINPVTGQCYRWDGSIERWVATGYFPFGPNPHDLV